MKIIKEGNVPFKTLRVTCSNCKARLEISRSDVKSSEARNAFGETVYGGDLSVTFWYKCPCCEEYQTLKPEQYQKLDFGIFK